MEPLAVEESVWIQAPRERVWRAITESEQIRQWWGGDYWEITGLQPGAEVLFGDEQSPIRARVSAAEAPREFGLRWPPLPELGDAAFHTTYNLDEENGGTRVRVRESGFEALAQDLRQARFDSTRQGYQTVLQDLKRYIEGEAA